MEKVFRKTAFRTFDSKFTFYSDDVRVCKFGSEKLNYVSFIFEIKTGISFQLINCCCSANSDYISVKIELNYRRFQ